jgi:hypothetical protein
MGVDEKIIEELGGSILREVEVGISTVKKADRVVIKEDVVYVIEIEDELNYAAIGQAIAYTVLYKEKFSPTTRVEPVIACSKFDRDLEYVCRKIGIRLIKI